MILKDIIFDKIKLICKNLIIISILYSLKNSLRNQLSRFIR